MPSEDTQFKKGNQRWKNVNPLNSGRPSKFKTPNDLWDAVYPYFNHCDNTPLLKVESTSTEKGTYTKTIECKIPYTWEGLYVFMGVCDLEHYKTKSDFSEILTYIANVIYSNKFSGAAANIFNAAIIAKSLGLSEKIDHTSSGKEIKAITGFEVK